MPVSDFKKLDCFAYTSAFWCHTEKFLSSRWIYGSPLSYKIRPSLLAYLYQEKLRKIGGVVFWSHPELFTIYEHQKWHFFKNVIFLRWSLNQLEFWPSLFRLKPCWFSWLFVNMPPLPFIHYILSPKWWSLSENHYLPNFVLPQYVVAKTKTILQTWSLYLHSQRPDTIQQSQTNTD